MAKLVGRAVSAGRRVLSMECALVCLLLTLSLIGNGTGLDGTLRCYPNPARQKPVTFAFRLREAARTTLSIYDPTARLIDRLERDGSASDNEITWDPAGKASGLYVARLEVAGQVLTLPFAILR